MQCIVPKIFYPMTASIYGHNFAVKFHRSESENFCYVYKLHRFVQFFCFAHELRNANWFVFFNFLSEAEHILALFLSFGQMERQCSYKVCSYKEEEV